MEDVWLEEPEEELEPVCEGDAVPVPVEEVVPVPEGVWVGVPDGGGELDGVPVCVGVFEGVMDAVGVLDLVTERVMRLEPVSLTEAEKLGEAEVEMETVMLTVDEEE